MKSHDGFVIAEVDLAIRGPGEFFGTRQWGPADLRVANLVRDAKILEEAREESARLLQEREPDLEYSPIVSVHLLFDRPLLGHPLAALLDSPAHWVFDRGRLTGHEPETGQYLTVVSSGSAKNRALSSLYGSRLAGRSSS